MHHEQCYYRAVVIQPGVQTRTRANRINVNYVTYFEQIFVSGVQYTRGIIRCSNFAESVRLLMVSSTQWQRRLLTLLGYGDIRPLNTKNT